MNLTYFCILNATKQKQFILNILTLNRNWQLKEVAVKIQSLRYILKTHNLLYWFISLSEKPDIKERNLYRCMKSFVNSQPPVNVSSLNRSRTVFAFVRSNEWQQTENIKYMSLNSSKAMCDFTFSCAEIVFLK